MELDLIGWCRSGSRKGSCIRAIFIHFIAANTILMDAIPYRPCMGHSIRILQINRSASWESPISDGESRVRPGIHALFM